MIPGLYCIVQSWRARISVALFKPSAEFSRGVILVFDFFIKFDINKFLELNIAMDKSERLKARGRT